MIDPHHPRSLWAGTAEAGLYHSADAGRTWSLAHLGIAGVPDNRAWVDAVDIFSWQSRAIYVQVTLQPAPDQFSEVWYRSTDGGLRWTATSPPLAPGHDVTGLTISARPPFAAYATADDGSLYVSTGGRHWRGSRPAVGPILADPTHPLTAYAVGIGAVLRTTDGGRTWRRWAGGTAQAYGAIKTAVLVPAG